MTPDITLIPGYDPYRDADGYEFDEQKAELACDFFADCLHHVKGELAGKPFILQPYQASIVANLFGWTRKDDGTRRYRTAFILEPRKNGKTTLAAGIGAYVFFCDGEAGAECYCAAADRDQAAITWSIVKEMTLKEPVLLSQCRIYKGHRSITIEAEGSSFKPVSADSYTKHGYNAHLVIFDELHARSNRDLVDVLETSMGSRRQPLIVYITTTDVLGESVCNEKLTYARSVRDGTIKDATYLPVIYEADPAKDDWKDPEVWARVNPGLGVSLKRDYFERKFKQACDEPHFENTFKRLHLNMQTSATTGFVPLDVWDACLKGTAKIIPKSKCFAGLDLASTRDITGFVQFFPGHDNLVIPHFWVPSEHKEVNKSYAHWIKQGYITTTPGKVTDYDYVRNRINLIAKGCDLEIAVDPWNSRQFSTKLVEEDGLKVVEFRQGFITMNEPTKELLRLILQGKVGHNANPVLRWMIGNADVRTDASENIKLDKKSSKGKIDGAVALVMAVGRAMFADIERGSVYDTRGLLTI